MAWFDQRGPGWKRGWKGEALSSLSLPPLPLLAVFSIVMLFLTLKWYMDCRAKIEETEISLRFLFVLIPVVLVLMAKDLFNEEGRLVVRLLPDAEQQAIHRAGGSPWGVAALIVVLLVLISYQSSFHSKWFRPLWWRSHYY